MKFFDYIRIGLKNISRQKARTILTIIAIVIGAMSVVIMLSLVIGAKKVMVKQIEAIGGLTMITVTGNPDMRTDQLLTSGSDNASTSKVINDALVTRFKAMDHITSVTPILGGAGAKIMMIEGSTKKSWANIMGYDVSSKVLETPITYGRGLMSSDMDKTVVGVGLLKELGLGNNPASVVGKNLILVFDGTQYPDWGALPPQMPISQGDGKDWWNEQQKKTHQITAMIVGVYSGGTDDRQAFINIEWAKKLQTNVSWQWQEGPKDQYGQSNPGIQTLVKDSNYLKNGYGSVILKVDNTKNIGEISDAIRKEGYGVATAEDMLKEISKVFVMIGVLVGAIGGISLFVAAIGIINTMIMATYERTREIGVMRACGATKKTIRRLFTFEAALLGFTGGVIGLILSFGLAQIGNLVANRVAISQSIPIAGFISFPPWLIFGVIIFTTFIGLVAGLYPAHRAAKLDPVEALRYE